MNEIPQLTLNFVTNHPRKAAKILEQLAVEDTVAFIEKIPPATGSKLLDFLPPQYSGQCFLILNPKSSAALIQGMKSTSTLSMLRIIPSKAINSLLRLLSPDKKVLLKKRLSFPQNSVGAWMDSDNPPVSETTLVGDIRRTLRNSKDVIDHAPCVVKADGTVAGLLSLLQLATAKEGNMVSKIMATDFNSILDRDSLQSAVALPDWIRFDALPVINQKGKYLGMLTQKNLDKGISLSTGGGASDPTDSILAECVNAYTSTLSWLVQAAIAPPVDPNTIEKTSNVR
ncbi:MAG: CBS domain-containing protein [Nitrospinota bacterium]|nr:CBS domain-containing protein [Nitrospinota bacterium]